MDIWGCDGCRENRDTIIGWLQDAAGKASWGEWWAFVKAVSGREWFRPLEAYGSIVDEAIRRAEEKGT